MCLNTASDHQAQAAERRSSAQWLEASSVLKYVWVRSHQEQGERGTESLLYVPKERVTCRGEAILQYKSSRVMSVHEMHNIRYRVCLESLAS